MRTPSDGLISIYISGPMTGYLNLNYPAFFEAEQRWRERGWVVVNPARINPKNSTNSAMTHEEARSAGIWADLKGVHETDALAVMADWHKSIGARAEVYTAYCLGHPVFHDETGEPMVPEGDVVLGIWAELEAVHAALSLVVPPDWEESISMRAKVYTARALGLPILDRETGEAITIE
jgi:hypothetical protein